MGNEAAEKTEEATTRRRNKERERGNVAKSRDLDSALVMIAGIALLAVFAKGILENILNMMRETFSHLHPAQISTDNIMGLLLPYFHYIAIMVLPFFVLLLIFSIIIIRMDVGHVFALQKAKFNLENLSPRRMFQNAKRIFNPFEPRSLVEFAKSVLKLVIVGACGYSAINSRKGDLLGLVGLEPTLAINIIISIINTEIHLKISSLTGKFY